MKKEFIYEGTVMGGVFSVTLIGEDREEALTMFQILHDEAKRYERMFSRFLPESELSRLNRARRAQVSDEVFAVVAHGVELYERTHGATNMLVSIKRFGYDEDISEVLGKERTADTSYAYNTNMTDLVLDKETRTITLAEGQEIDVASFLKGYVAEELAQMARGFSGVIVNLSGDIFVSGYDAQQEPFVFEIENPHDGETLRTFSLLHGAIATSGSYRRYWSVAGEPVHHVLNARGEKNPDTDAISTTVIAPKGYEADGFATAGLVLGTERGAELLLSEGFHYLFVRKDGSLVSTFVQERQLLSL